MKTLIIQKMFTVAFFVLCAFLIIPFASAGLPEFVTYQGHVVDSQDEPLEGPFDTTFRIYDRQDAIMGEEIWRETHAGLPISEGNFSVKIGSVSAQSASPLRNLAFDKPYWLGIEIASQGELQPRQSLEAVPFAYRVHDGVTMSENQIITGDKAFTGDVYGAETPGMIAMFDTSCPAGWTRFAAADGAILFGGETYAGPQDEGVDQLPAHTHAQDPHGHLLRVDAPNGTPGPYLSIGQAGPASFWDLQVTSSVVATTVTNQSTGSAKFITMVLCKKD